MAIPLKKGWNIANARKLIRAETNIKQHIKPILYRPFDRRLIFYHDSLVWRTVRRVMRHMLAGDNQGLISTRQTRDQWNVFATSCIVGHKSLAAYDINSLFPLYLYADPSKPIKEDMEQIQTWPEGKDGQRPNLDHRFVDDFAAKLKLTFVSDGRGDLKKTYGPEDILHYIYAVFHSPTYRSRYAGFLKVDFPRVPLTSDVKLFRKLCAFGHQLVALHLMEKPGPTMTTFPIAGNNAVEKVRYTAPGQGADQGRVWINKNQYFEGVPPHVWEFHVGGYQVCHKWLKDRKARKLTYDDLTHYQCVLSALAKTDRLMQEIDDTIPSWPMT